ncbi:MAG TPA: hypothetical protein PKW95_10640 [bacterium]|nr:hypothetical protein [bacterium]
MQIDAHYYGMYLLMRALGFTPEQARIAAYANQYTDDSKQSDEIEFSGNTPNFDPVRTAHYGLDLNLIKKKNMNLVAQEIWMSFHFLPAGIKGKYPPSPLLTRPGKGPAKALVKRALKWIGDGRPYGYHALGIAAHSFLDTYSHQFFSGRQGPENGVSTKAMLSFSRAADRSLWKKITNEIEEYLEKKVLGLDVIPNIGHAEAVHFPDRPFLHWQYYDWKGDPYTISNHERFMTAFKDLFAMIAAHLGLSEAQQRAIWHAEQGKYGLYDVYYKLFLEDDWNSDDRMKNWRKVLPKTMFVKKSEAINLVYDDDAWMDEAIQFPSAYEVGMEHMLKAEPKDNFADSNFVQFHIAARMQREYVMDWIKRNNLNKLLSSLSRQRQSKGKKVLKSIVKK